MRITKAIEPLTGMNASIARQKLGRMHCMTGLLQLCRDMRPKNTSEAPARLRRGLIFSIWWINRCHRRTYVNVMARHDLKSPPTRYVVAMNYLNDNTEAWKVLDLHTDGEPVITFDNEGDCWKWIHSV